MSSEVIDDTETMVVKLADGEDNISFLAPSFSFTGRKITFEGNTPEPNQAVSIMAREKLFNVFPVSTEIASGKSNDLRLFSVEHTFGKVGYYTLYAKAGDEKTPDLNMLVISTLIAGALVVAGALLARKLGGKI